MLRFKCDATSKDNLTDKGKPPERNPHVLDVLHRTEYGGLFLMKKIPLTQGKFTMVDDEDYNELNKIKWNAHKERGRIYATHTGKRVKGIPIILRMHRAILKPSKQFDIDHIDGNGLNNQRSNLRICSRSENCRNKGKPKNNSSGFKGVSWAKREKMWRAYTNKNGKQIFLGYFSDILDAAKVYNNAVCKHHGDFAWLNIIDERMDSNDKTRP